jgi:nucleotide-binding universal stress UspA family protein
MNESVDPQAVVVAVKRILVPLDRSGYKEKITAYAVSLGKAGGAEIMAIHVIEPEHTGLSYRMVELKQRKRQEKKQEDRLNIYLMKSILWQRKKA